VAPKQPREDGRHLYEDGVGDSRGWYKDGAYTAAPFEEYDEVEDTEAGSDPQLVYFSSILTRLSNLRSTLHQTPPDAAVASLDENHPIHMTATAESYRSWRWKIENVDPSMVQLACMDKASVLRLLKLITSGKWLGRGRQISPRISRWIWGLLARLPEVGELNSEEVGVVREVGKKAVWVGVGFKEARDWADGLDEVERDIYGAGDEGEDEEEEFVGEVDVEIVENDVGDGMEDDGSDAREADISIDLSTPVTEKKNTHIVSEPTVLEKAEEGAEDLEAARLRILSRLGEAHSIGDTEAQHMPSADPTALYADPQARVASTDDQISAKDQVNETRQPGHVERDIEEEEEGEEIDLSVPTPNTRVTLDTIITVAGEVYGQRDLLEFREIWQ
jgi:hypothetical protein